MLFIHCFQKSLMIEENLSFPDITTPLSGVQNPPINDDSIISELHHGDWWTNSWAEICTPGTNEILVPIILYMDGISIDNNGRLSLTPLNMTLGIFNVETRTRPESWETIYFHPSNEFESKHHDKTTTSQDSLKNLHAGLKEALQTFDKACKLKDGIEWDYLPYNKQIFKVKMKFAISFVIGDTELHDKICNKYGSRTGSVRMLCRHCDCTTNEINNPEYFHKKCKLWTSRQLDNFLSEDFSDEQRINIGKSISHHIIENTFHSLEFGKNQHNIHLASPGETLHMLQLGAQKRFVESFSKQYTSHTATNDIIRITCQKYGALLSRQSDRDFPRTKFGSSILSTTKKEGGDYAGILISLLVCCVSKKGREALRIKGVVGDRYKLFIHTIELLLGMEEFLKHGFFTKKELVQFLPKTIIHFINCINETCYREGMGTRLIKNHLFFHIPLYIKYFGRPKNWDSAYSEIKSQNRDKSSGYEHTKKYGKANSSSM